MLQRVNNTYRSKPKYPLRRRRWQIAIEHNQILVHLTASVGINKCATVSNRLLGNQTIFILLFFFLWGGIIVGRLLLLKGMVSQGRHLHETIKIFWRSIYTNALGLVSHFLVWKNVIKHNCAKQAHQYKGKFIQPPLCLVLLVHVRREWRYHFVFAKKRKKLQGLITRMKCPQKSGLFGLQFGWFFRGTHDIIHCQVLGQWKWL